MSRVQLALAPEVEKQLNHEIEEAWHLMQISRGLTTGFWLEVQRALEREYRLRALLRIRRAARQAAKAVVVAGLLLAAAIAAPTVHAAEPFTADDTLAALEGASPEVVCIVRQESTFQPYAIGTAGEQGAVQILPGGSMWPLFWEADWTATPPGERSTWNPYLSVEFLTWALDQGYGPAWSAWWGC